MKNTIQFIKMHPALSAPGGESLLPATGHDEDAGIDCYALEDFTLPPLNSVFSPTLLLSNTPASKCIPLGFGIKMPKRTILDRILHKYWRGEITGRSSQNKEGVLVMRGVVDYGYQGEYKVCLVNLNNYPVSYKKGDRICQILFAKVRKVTGKELRVLNNKKRQGGGFGSTGK